LSFLSFGFIFILDVGESHTSILKTIPSKVLEGTQGLTDCYAMLDLLQSSLAGILSSISLIGFPKFKFT
jgi:hypothetical protein